MLRLVYGFPALLLWFVVFLNVGTAMAADPPPPPTVVEVRVEHDGDGSVDAESVNVYLEIKKGDVFDRMVITRDVRTLKDTGRFSNVGSALESTDDGVVVIYRVHPRPVIGRLTIKGARTMSNKKIRKKLELGAGDPVDDSIMAVKSRTVIEAYRKKNFPAAQLKWDIEEDVAASKATVTVTIKEGERARVRRIDFTGADHVSVRKLRKYLTQKRANIFSFITGRGVFNPDLIESDRSTIKRQFHNHGFLDVQVGEPNIEYIGGGIIMTYPIVEGIQYHVRSIKLQGNALFSEDDIKLRSLRLLPGEVAAQDKIDETRQAIHDYYGSRGYIRSNAAPEVDTDSDLGVIDVVFKIHEGTKAYIQNIAIQGNTWTKDKVIRRELTVAPQEVFNKVRVRQSERRLRNLEFFGYVSATPVPTDEEDTYDLIFEVEEQRSGQFMVGAGFSSIDDIIGFVELSQGNFDFANWPQLKGAGQKFKVRLQLGTERRDWIISFTEPWFLDQRLRLDFELFQHERNFFSDDYDQLNSGGSVSLTRPLRGPYRLRLAYSLEEIDVTNVSAAASDLIKSQGGASLESSLELSLIRDTRNNFFVPTAGSRTVPSASVSGGPLGGDIELYTMRLRSTYFWPLWYEHVFNVRGQIAVVEEWGDTKSVPIFDRLFLGGARNMRGFDFRDVGPKDSNGEPLGGQSSAYMTLEYTIPIIEQIRAAAFYDVGQVYPKPYEFGLSDLNSDWGIGLRINMPGLPFQLDYAWPIEADRFNDGGGRFNFFLGYQN